MSYTTIVDGLELYKHSEFPVTIGNPKSSLALCVVWQDIEKILNFHPEFKEKFALIGNLRSPFGVNIIIYNLALNSHIKKLIVWGPDKLSNTNTGLSGKDTLLTLYKNGINEQKQIIGSPFKLVDEIDSETLNKILQNVKIHEWSDKENLDLNELPATDGVNYMDAVRFPEFKVKAPESHPSEEISIPIRENKGADAFLSLLHHIWVYGQKTPFNIGEPEVKEIRYVVVVVEKENPDDIFLPDWLFETKELGITKESLENYYKTQFRPDVYYKEIFNGVKKFEKPKDYAYLYAELIYAFPRPEEITNTLEKLFEKGGYEATKSFLIVNSQVAKDARENWIKKVEASDLSDKEKIEVLLEVLIPVVNQVENVIDRIKRKNVDLDKEIILWDPRCHSKLESGRPCILKLSFSVRNNKIDVHVFVRSHDITQAWFYNFYGISKLLGYIAKETGYGTGKIIIETQSAHIYQRDWETVEKLLKSKYEEEPMRMFFDSEKDTDARGVVNISVLDGKINFKLFSPTGGDLIFEINGTTAREIMYKIKHNHLLSRTDHAAFIGSELAKAEMCMKLGIEYKYDNPIKLPTGERIVS